MSCSCRGGIPAGLPGPCNATLARGPAGARLTTRLTPRLKARRTSRSRAALRRLVLEVVGWTLVLLGIAGLLLPGPGLLPLFGGMLGVVWLVGLGLYWGSQPPPPGWWPLRDSWWLVGGWATGGTLIFSGVYALVLIVYSYRRYRTDPYRPTPVPPVGGRPPEDGHPDEVRSGSSDPTCPPRRR